MNLEESFGGPTARSPAAMIPLVVEECVCSVSSHPAGPHKALSGARGMPHWRYPWTDRSEKGCDWSDGESHHEVEAVGHRMVAGVEQVDLGALHRHGALAGNLGCQGEGRIKHDLLVWEDPAEDERHLQSAV